MNTNFESADYLNDVKTNPNVLFKRLGNEMVLFHLQTDHFYELSGTAARFWELLHEGHDVDQVRSQMMKEFAVESDEFDAEAQAFLTSLRQEDLITNDE